MDSTLVIGAGGQLGQCFKKVAKERNVSEDIVFPEERTADILNRTSLSELFKLHKPKYVINCAAYTAVDLAEEEIESATLVNVNGPLLLAKMCKEHGAVLIHVSTDFVFEGNEIKLLNEDDITNPINVYGQTKLDGEKAVASILDSHFIVRTSWLYSEYGNNFVKTMIKLAANRDELNIIADQVGTPTYAIDLADAIYDIICSKSNKYGIYHFSNEGVTSWYDFAEAIFDISNTNVKVNPIPSSAYPTKAKRPSFSVMDKSKIKDTFEIKIPYWRSSLAKCILRLKEVKM